MKTFTKSLLGVGAAAAALVSVAPAQAQYRDRDRYRDNDGISAGEIIAGAVVLGGLAAILSDNDRYDDRYDRRGYNNYNYNRNGGSRAAINRCVNQVENWASRYSRSEVTQIRDIDRTRYGYRVQGNLVVQDGWRGGGRYDRDRYDRDDRYGDNRYGYNRGYDRGRFTCYIERGRVVDIDYSGLDQWR